MREAGTGIRGLALDARAVLLLGAALVASGWVQWPALESDFKHDDFLFFYQAANLAPLDFALETHAGHLLLVRNTLFLVFFEAFGLDPKPYFAVALVTHLFNVSLLWFVVARLTNSFLVAAIVAALWGMAPANQASVNWVSIYGNITAATFTLLVLAELAHLGARRAPPSAWALMRWGLLLVAAATSFGPGFGAALALAPVTWLLLPPEGRRTTAAICMAAVALVLVVYYFAATTASVSPSVIPRSFSVSAMVSLFFGLWAFGFASLVLGPLITVGAGATPDGVIYPSVGIGPLRGFPLEAVLVVASEVAVVGGAILGWAFWRARSEHRRQMLGFVLLAGAIYGLIALGRAYLMFERDFDLAWMATTSRYHYVATVALAACLGIVLSEVRVVCLNTFAWSRSPVSRWVFTSAACVWLALAAAPYQATSRRVDTILTTWSRKAYETARRRIESRLKQGGSEDEILIPNEEFAGMAYVRSFIAPEDFPGTAAVFVFTHPEDTVGGRRVRFVEPDRALVEALRSRSRTRMSALLISAEEAGRHLAPPGR